jgi:hypothetical protein
MSVERDERGCYPGCYSHGCEATDCNLFKAHWREEQWRKKREAEKAAAEAARLKPGWQPDGRYLTDFEVRLLESLQQLTAEVRDLTAAVRRRR